jgi:hypothetical protein
MGAVVAVDLAEVLAWEEAGDGAIGITLPEFRDGHADMLTLIWSDSRVAPAQPPTRKQLKLESLRIWRSKPSILKKLLTISKLVSISFGRKLEMPARFRRKKKSNRGYYVAKR